MKKSIILYIFSIVFIFCVIIIVFNLPQVKEKMAIEFIIFSANLPDSPIKEVFIKHIRKNLSSDLLIPALKIIISNEDRTINAGGIIYKIISSNPLPPDILNAMVANIDNKDPRIRIEIIYFINSTNSPEALKAVMERAEYDNNVEVRQKAIRSLDNFNFINVGMFLAKQLKSENPQIQESAADALSYWIPTNFGYVDDELKNKLIEFIHNPQKDENARAKLIDSIRRIFRNNNFLPLLPQIEENGYSISKKIVMTLLPLLNDNSKKVRIAAINNIGISAVRDDIKYIKPFLSDPDNEIAEEAKKAIKNIEYLNPLPSPTPSLLPSNQ